MQTEELKNKEDLRNYSDDELSLRVFNDEILYDIRHKRDFIEVIDDIFIYTEEQLNILKNDLINDLNELTN